MRIEKTPVDFTGEPIVCPDCGGYLEYDYGYQANCRVCGMQVEPESGPFKMGITFRVERVRERLRERREIRPLPCR